MAKTALKSYSLNEMEDKYIGRKNTIARKTYEQELQTGILGQTIKQLRRERKLTREQLGKMAGIQKAQVARIENTAGTARIDSIVKVLKVLNADIHFSVLVNGRIKEIRGIIDPSMRNYENDPLFVKKAAEMKALIDKVGLPEKYYRKK